MARVVFFFGVAVSAWVMLVSGAASARIFNWRPSAQPYFKDGFADQVTVNGSVGNVDIHVVCPVERSTPGVPWRATGARVTLEQVGYGYRTAGVINALLRDATNRIWDTCPIGQKLDRNVSIRSYDIGFVDIYARRDSGAEPTRVVSAIKFQTLFGQKWESVVDVGGQQSRPSATSGVDQSQSTEVAQAVQGVSTPSQSQIVRMQTSSHVKEPEYLTILTAQSVTPPPSPWTEKELEGWKKWYDFWDNVWLFIRLAFFGSIALYIYSKRDTIAFWYYSLTPHPASDMVHAAVNAGVELDGAAFSEILRPIPGGHVEMQVRAKQARELTELARTSAAELARKAEELRQKVREQAAYQAAHTALHDSTIDQQLAAVRAEALAKVHAFMNREKKT